MDLRRRRPRQKREARGVITETSLGRSVCIDSVFLVSRRDSNCGDISDVHANAKRCRGAAVKRGNAAYAT